jgi:hypothetical protein
MTDRSNPVVLTYDEDQLCICGAEARFGFGPPLTRGGVVVWACARHRDEIDRELVRQSDLHHGGGA